MYACTIVVYSWSPPKLLRIYIAPECKSARCSFQVATYCSAGRQSSQWPISGYPTNFNSPFAHFLQCHTLSLMFPYTSPEQKFPRSSDRSLATITCTINIKRIPEPHSHRKIGSPACCKNVPTRGKLRLSPATTVGNARPSR